MPQSSNEDSVAVYGVVHAAVAGEAAEAMLHDWGDRSALEAVTETMLASPLAGLAVVTTSNVDFELDLAEDPRFVTVVEDTLLDELGTARRAAAALREVLDLPAVFGICVCPGSIPGVDVASVTACVHAYQRDPDRIAAATFGGRMGRPLVLPHALVDSRSEGTLVGLLEEQGKRVQAVECETPAILEGLNSSG